MSDEADQPDSLDERAARVLHRLGDDSGEATDPEGDDDVGSGTDGDPGRKDNVAKQEGEGDDDAIAPPVSWSNDEKQTFRKLPRETQAVIARREGERDRMLSQRAQDFAQRERALDEQRRGYVQRLEAFIAR